MKKRIKSHKISHKKFHSRQDRAIYTKEVVRLISLFHNYFCCDHLYQFYIRLWTCDRAVAKLKIHGKGSKNALIFNKDGENHKKLDFWYKVTYFFSKSGGQVPPTSSYGCYCVRICNQILLSLGTATKQPAIDVF